MGSGIDGDEHFKCSTWKVDFYANFHPKHDFFLAEALLTLLNCRFFHDDFVDVDVNINF